MVELLTRQEVEQICRLSRSSIYRLMRLRKFVQPIRVGERAIRFRRDEILEWLETRPRATGEGDANAA